MNTAHSRLPLALVLLAGALGAAVPASAQVAGTTTTVDVSVSESTRLALGWSVKKTLLGKAVYNEAGQKVGKVEDLIVAPDRNVSFVIVGAGGFAGIGRHDVAVLVTRIQDRGGRLVMLGATPESVKAMPSFTYADDSARRAQFIAAAEADIVHGKAMVAELEKKSGTAASQVKAQLDLQAAAVGGEVKAAEARLGELKQASAKRWKEFETAVSAATARLRKSMEPVTG
ncbi:MAG: PRC-barrel domain-containing protein [Ideonella sp.]|nr:PRC-barrel domain-containing protein [Ideonella sp.]